MSSPLEQISEKYKNAVVGSIDAHKVCTIQFNRISKFNAINPDLVCAFMEMLHFCASSALVHVVVITGGYKNKIFCAGNDMTNFKPLLSGTNIPKEQVEKIVSENMDLFCQLVDTIIDFPKVLIAAVNGHAIGFGATMLPLCDFVYCASNATFHTPFTQLAINPEGCSSFTFPLLMGRQKANEMLILGKKLDAQEAAELRLVNKVFASGEELEDGVTSIARTIAKFPQSSIGITKRMMREQGGVFESLKRVNKQESEELKRRFMTRGALQAAVRFMLRKSKL